jgi:arginyl-tRNA synthetase
MCNFFEGMSLREILENLIEQALKKLQKKGSLSATTSPEIKVEKTRDSRYGDFASNIAMILAAHSDDPPRKLAESIVNLIPESDLIERIEIAGPGFINFFLEQKAFHQVVNNILETGEKYGRCNYGNGDPVLVEFVSANPTGPLHIGHGRGAAYGAATANLLETIGYKVDQEYYVNDSGRQMDILAVSVYLRYLQKCNVNISIPDKAYQGDYIKSIAEKIHEQSGDKLKKNTDELVTLLTSESDPEEQLDDLITCIKSSLGDDNYLHIYNTSLDEILTDIRQDLEEFGIIFDQWFSERSLLISGKVNKCIEQLRQFGHLYDKDGAVWFRSTDFGDEKDRVVVRENGQLTYFASDIAYHLSKFERGYHRVLDIWGADHHGYINRVKAALAALKINPENLEIMLVQFASLYRGHEKIQMSTRAGQFVTLRELRNEVGKDAARFFYVLHKSEQHLDFDLELAKSQSQDNPVYYIQYAHARICSVLRQLHEKGMQLGQTTGSPDLSMLNEKYELGLLAKLAEYPEIVLDSALNYAPHQISYYLRGLANEFHTYYNACQILVDDNELRNARLSLVCAIRQVIRNGLKLLGVSAPEVM